MQPIRYLQIDAISVCFSPAHIVRVLRDIVKVNKKKIQCFYNVDPSYYKIDPIWWYANGVQRMRFPVIWSDTEQAYRILSLLRGFGQTEIAQLGTIRPCCKAMYKQDVVYIPSVKRTTNIVSNDEAENEEEPLLEIYEDRTPGNPDDFIEIIYNLPESPERIVVNPDDYELYID